MALVTGPQLEGSPAPTQGLNGPRGREAPPLALGNGAPKDMGQMSPEVTGILAPQSQGEGSPARGDGALGGLGEAPPLVMGEVAPLVQGSASPTSLGEVGGSTVNNSISILNNSTSQMNITNNPSANKPDTVDSVNNQDAVVSAINQITVDSACSTVNSVNKQDTVYRANNQNPFIGANNQGPTANNILATGLNPSVFRDHNTTIILDTVIFYISKNRAMAQAVLCEKIANHFSEMSINQASQILKDLNLTRLLRSTGRPNSKTKIYNLVKLVRDMIINNPHVIISTVSTDFPPEIPTPKKNHLALSKLFHKKSTSELHSNQVSAQLEIMDEKINNILQIVSTQQDIIYDLVATSTVTHPVDNHQEIANHSNARIPTPPPTIPPTTTTLAPAPSSPTLPLPDPPTSTLPSNNLASPKHHQLLPTPPLPPNPVT